MTALPIIRKIRLAAIIALTIFCPIHLKVSAQSSTVPPPPTARADHFGVYNWNINDEAMPATTNQLEWGAELVAGMGTRTIRITLATRDDYRLGLPNNLDLAGLAQLPAYDKVLRDARFKTIMLTTYSRGAMASNWADGYTQTEYETERDEIKRLGEYLLNNPAFAGKTFILFNWEGDNAMASWPNKRTVWDYYVNWNRARVEGVKLARQKYPASNASLFSGLEFNQVRSYQTGDPCGTPVSDPVRVDPLKNRCVVDYVAPQVEVDYYSYSSWSSLEGKIETPNESLKQRYKTDLTLAMSLIKTRRPEIAERNFILGEYGFERATYGECNAANNVSEMFDALEGADAFQVSYAVFWQIVDNAPFYGVGVDSFGLYRLRDGQLGLSLVGENFKKRLAGETVPSLSGCPRIRTSPELGVLNGQGLPNFQINPDSVISIYTQGCCDNVTTPFSASGNKVHFNQASRHYELPRDNALFFYESPSQINFSMPAQRRTGFARVYVTDARGYDSNAQTIAVTCNDCPYFASCGLVEANYQTLQIAPGDVVTLTGQRFSPSGNTIVIEQRVTQQTFQKWTLHDFVSESATQINLKLPNDLVPERETVLYIINAQGRESTETILPVSQPCPSGGCPARLKICQGVLPETAAGFAAGQPASIFGRFAPSGNKVILEQVDRQNRVYRYELAAGTPAWAESDKQILFTLPTNLFAGRLLIYVTDAQGRESRAQEINVSSVPPTFVSSANYRIGTLAVESLATIFGSAMATATQVATTTPLPNELAGTRVVVKDSAGVERDSPLFFVAPTQINFQVPPGTALGNAKITVFNGYGSFSVGQAEIVSVNPGVFAADATGKGVAAAVALRIKPDGSQIYEPVAIFDATKNAFVARPIDLGSEADQVFLVLFGTGIRNRSQLSAITALVGGVSIQPTFAGAQNDFVGLDQLNLPLPHSLAGRGEVNVSLSVDGLSANPVKVSIK